MIISDQFGTIQNIQRALIPKTSNWSGNIFGRFLQQTGSRDTSLRDLCILTLVTTKFEDVDLPTLRKWMLKHFVKGFLFRKDLEFGSVPVSHIFFLLNYVNFKPERKC